MQFVEVDCKGIKGLVEPPISKSIAHRYVIAACLAGRLELLDDEWLCDDLIASVECVKAISELFQLEDSASDHEDCTARSACRNEQNKCDRLTLDCKESATTLRLLMPIVAALGFPAEFIRRGHLKGRPVRELEELLMKHGIELKDEADYISISGRLTAGEYEIPADISSQYISGLLFALPLLDGDSSLKLIGDIQSAPYIRLSERTLEQFGIKFEYKASEQLYEIRGKQRYRLPEVYGVIERDWSAGAMWLAAGTLEGVELELSGLNENSEQADARIVEFLTAIRSCDSESECRLDIADCPDLVGAIALAALSAKCDVRICNAGRLRYKECDRLEATARILSELGADIEQLEDGLLIHPADGMLRGSSEVIDCCNDHRMVMLAALASIKCERSVKLRDADSVGKSYPDFFEQIEALGGRLSGL